MTRGPCTGFAVLFAWVSYLTFRNGDEVLVAAYVEVLDDHDIESLSSQIFDFR